MLDILTIRPLFKRSSGENALVTLMTPNKFTSMTRRKTFSDVNSISDTDQIPALFTTAQRPVKNVIHEVSSLGSHTFCLS